MNDQPDSSVIPAEAGIQTYFKAETGLDPGLRRGDDSARVDARCFIDT